MSFSLHASAFLFDLRVIRRLLQDNVHQLPSQDDIDLAHEGILKIIERIEDFNAFLQAIEAQDESCPPEAGLGSG